ncbi:MAG: hypothetical protein IPM45_00665 [Acidimicrobiales bacterium]|nr:hypothetical protein [Acidimicrobiales bacterium]
MASLRAARPRWAVVGLAVAVALLAGACGDDDDGADATTDSASDTSVAGEASDFCGFYFDAADAADGLGTATDAAGVEESLAEGLRLSQEALAVAPAEIADEYAVVVAGIADIYALAGDSGFDPDAFSTEPGFQELAQDPDINAANDTVNAWVMDTCPQAVQPSG